VLRGGELLLSTGMGLPSGDAAQRRFVASLAERDVAGLVIELHTSIDRVPRAVIAEAEARGLPLIALHREIRFVEVTEALHREIVNRRVRALERGEEAHRRVFELVLEGAGVPEVLAELAELVGNQLVVEKAGEGVLFHQPHGVPDAALHAAWDAVSRRLPEAPEHLSVPISLGHDRLWGTLSALALSGPLGEHDRVVLERGVSVIGLALLRRDEERSLAARRRGDFLAALMEPEASIDERGATAMAADFGLERRALLRLPLIVLATYDWGGEGGEAAWAPAWREITSELEATRISAVAGVLPRERALAMVVALPSAAARAELAGRISRIVRRAAERTLGPARLTVCVGAAVRSWAETGGALRDALETGRASSHGPEREWLDAAAPDIDRLLWGLRDHPATRLFVEQRLEAVLAHDREHRTQFEATLEAYFRHGGRIADTARALHVHRQSLYKRIERIEALVGGELTDPDLRLGLHFALRARRYLDDIDSGAGPP
jgi:purine catabolism regulator